MKRKETHTYLISSKRKTKIVRSAAASSFPWDSHRCCHFFDCFFFFLFSLCLPILFLFSGRFRRSGRSQCQPQLVEGDQIIVHNLTRIQPAKAVHRLFSSWCTGAGISAKGRAERPQVARALSCESRQEYLRTHHMTGVTRAAGYFGDAANSGWHHEVQLFREFRHRFERAYTNLGSTLIIKRVQF